MSRSATNQRIVVIGMSGLIGGLVGRKLAQQHDGVALNRSPVDGAPWIQGDITDLDTVLAAFESADLVINLATHQADSSDASDPQDVAAYIATTSKGPTTSTKRRGAAACGA